MTFRVGPGRNFTDYRASCIIDEKLKDKLNVKDDISYKTVLQEDGLKILENRCQKCNRPKSKISH